MQALRTACSTSTQEAELDFCHEGPPVLDPKTSIPSLFLVPYLAAQEPMRWLTWARTCESQPQSQLNGERPVPLVMSLGPWPKPKKPNACGGSVCLESGAPGKVLPLTCIQGVFRIWACHFSVCRRRMELRIAHHSVIGLLAVNSGRKSYVLFCSDRRSMFTVQGWGFLALAFDHERSHLFTSEVFEICLTNLPQRPSYPLTITPLYLEPTSFSHAL